MPCVSSSLETPPFVAIIPARLASSRLPNKPLADIDGLPMVVRVAQRAQAANAVRVLIATDAQCICDAAHAHGYEAILTRHDHPSGTDRISEAAQHCGLSGETLIVNVQGDEPLIDPALIRAVAAHWVNQSNSVIATAVHPITEVTEVWNPNVVKAVLDAQGNALYFSRAPIPWNLKAWPARWRGESPPLTLTPPLYRHIGLYAYRASFLYRFVQLPPAPIETVEALEQLRALWHGERIAALITHQAPAPSVDTPADLAHIRALFTARVNSNVA